MNHPRPIIAISMGDPGGIGPEVIVKALRDPRLRRSACFRVYGELEPLEHAASQLGLEPFWWVTTPAFEHLDTTTTHDVVIIDDTPRNSHAMLRSATKPLHQHPGPSKSSGERSYRWVHAAIDAALAPASSPMHAHAIVTGPISKEAWALAGHAAFPGHTELLAARCRSKRFAMMFHAAPPLSSASQQHAQHSLDNIGLNVILATVHIPLAQVPDVLTIGKVFDAIDLGANALRDLGIASPRIAVCGLNPHAGEQGLLGNEEQRIIAPAIRLANDAGLNAQGPFPGDAIFHRALARPNTPPDFDLVVAMYHDQGLIPLKLLARDRAVNRTVGLDIIRTSPDHGTAFDIAGKGKADAGSMHAALQLAVDLASKSAGKPATQ